MKIDEGLKQYAATERQAEYIDAVIQHGSLRKASRELGVNHKTIYRAIDVARSRAQMRGYAPESNFTRPVPEMFTAKGVSTLYDREGNVAAQWVKANLDEKKRLEAVQSVIESLCDEVPRLEPIPGPTICNAALATVYTLTDSHVGMLSWGRETGGDWDLEIAERVLTGCFKAMVDASPASAMGIVNQLGDFLHSDGLTPITPTSGHILDQDGRFSKVVEVSVRVLRAVIGMALQKHERVLVIMAEGNHDMASSVWLRVLFKALYENEPRVQVIDSPLPYYCVQHGKTMLAFHHGHLKKNDQLPILFAAQFPKVWGDTTKRYCHTGHRHHSEEKEHSGITVIQHPTLAARDAYAARGGWVAERQVTSITYHDEYGQVARNTVTPEMIGH